MSGKFHLLLYFLVVSSITTTWYFIYLKHEKTNITIIEDASENVLNYTGITKSVPEYLFGTKFEYLLNNRVCDRGNKDITAVILVTSYYGNVETRSAMRRAFSNDELIGFDMRRVFLIALPPANEKSITPKAILNENERFGDLIQGNFYEAYRNLTYKHTMGLHWAGKYCSNAKFVIKMDDDIVVDIYKLSDFLHKFELPAKKPIAGYTLKAMPVIRQYVNKWYVTKKEYPHEIYPPFVSGWFYITTPKTAKSLASFTKNVPYFWIDDVYITGIVAQKLHMKHMDIRTKFGVFPEFLHCCMKDLKAHNYNCPIMVGPNGGDNNLFFTYNEVMSKCYVFKCKERPSTKDLNSTCIVERKPKIGFGKALVEQISLS